MFLDLDEVEDPLYEIQSFESREDSILLEYKEERQVFTKLSETVFEDEAGVRYFLEKDTTVADYEKSLLEN